MSTADLEQQHPSNCAQMECLDIFPPVCGFDGVTYSHDCELERHNCYYITRGQSKDVVVKAYDGECGPLGPYQWIIIILGIVVGSLLVVIIFTVVSCKLWKKYAKKESSNENTMYSSPTFNTLRDSFKAEDHYDAGYTA